MLDETAQRQFLERMAVSPNLRGLFSHDKRELLGFKIGWMLPEFFADFCKGNCLPFEQCELILMEATGMTECHMHKLGGAMFMPLGSTHGFPDPKGGTLIGSYSGMGEGVTLTPYPARAGQVFRIEPGKVHAFYTEPGKSLSAIGLIYPKIRQNEEFDVVPFELIETAGVYTARERGIVGPAPPFSFEAAYQGAWFID